MGRESRLRHPKPQSRYEYTNGDKKLYDRDHCPEGLDQNVWSLTLLFEQYAEKDGYTIPGRPVVYTELYNRISHDSQLTQLLRTTTSSTDSTSGTDADYCYTVLERMIYLYWNTSNNYDYSHSINDFCSTTVFNYLKTTVFSIVDRNTLLATGTLVPQVDAQIKPSKRSEQEKEVAEIKYKTYTEKELKDKIERWQRNHS